MIKKFFYSTLDQLNISGTNFLFLVMGARMLPANDQALLLAIFFFYILIIIVGYGLNFSNSYHLNRYQTSKYLELLIKFHFPILFFISIAFSLFFTIFGAGNKLAQSYSDFFPFVIFSIFIFLMASADFIRRSFYILGDSKRASIIGIYTSIFRLIAMLILLTFFKFNLLNYLALWSLASFISIYFFIKKIKIKYVFNSKDFQDYLLHMKRGYFGAINQSLGWINSYTPFYFLSYFAGPLDASIFGSVRGLIGFMNIISEQFDTIYPKFFSMKSRGEFELQDKKVIHMSFYIFWAIFLLLLIIFGDLILNFILGKNFEPYGFILVLGWIGTGFYMINRNLVVKKRLGQNFTPEIFANLASIFPMLICLYLIYLFGIVGAAFSSLLLPLSFFIFMNIFSSKFIGVSKKVKFL